MRSVILVAGVVTCWTSCWKAESLRSAWLAMTGGTDAIGGGATGVVGVAVAALVAEGEANGIRGVARTL